MLNILEIEPIYKVGIYKSLYKSISYEKSGYYFMKTKNHSQLIIPFWFTIVCIVMAVILIVVMYRLTIINQHVETIVSENNVKSDLLVKMRETIRQRQISLRSIFLTQDYFKRDQERMHFYIIARNFVEARDHLLTLPINKPERILLKRIVQAMKKAYPQQNDLVEVAVSQVAPKNLEARLQKALSAQSQVIGLMNQLIRYQRQQTNQAIDETYDLYSYSMLLMTMLGIFGGMFIFSTGYYVYRKAESQTKKIEKLAKHDDLTKLINRREFESRLDDMISDARITGDQHAILFIDLDHFKIVNDTCGHIAGDEVLKQISKLFKTKIRGTDTLARLGGDEFGVLLGNCPINKAADIAEQLRSVAEEFCFVWNNKSFDLTTSIGVAPITAEVRNLSEIMSCVDTACYVSKDQSRNQVHVYQNNDHSVNQRQGEMQWIPKIKQALEDDLFEIYFQRIKAINENLCQLNRGEVLLRLKDNNGKIIAPTTFIPAAERYHLMPTVDRWVVKTTLSHIADFIQLHSKGIYISINLSGQSIMQPGFKDFLRQEIISSGVPPEYLCFEITETAAIANLDLAVDLMTDLQKFGCKFALDDFGSGMSSFSYLKNLNVDYLKIDGVFVREIVNDTTNYTIIESINKIGQCMGIQTTAEFVENDGIITILNRIGVDFAQGYGIEKPKPFTDLLKMTSQVANL